MLVRIQVIKVYEIEAESADAALTLQSTQIEAEGKLVNVETDFAEEVESGTVGFRQKE